MRILIMILAATLAVSGCTTLDGTIKDNLPKTCDLINTAHAAFIAASASGDVKASTIAKEKAAYEGVQVICADPGSVNASNALVLVAQAYATISIALKEAD